MCTYIERERDSCIFISIQSQRCQNQIQVCHHSTCWVGLYNHSRLFKSKSWPKSTDWFSYSPIKSAKIEVHPPFLITSKYYKNKSYCWLCTYIYIYLHIYIIIYIYCICIVLQSPIKSKSIERSPQQGPIAFSVYKPRIEEPMWLDAHRWHFRGWVGMQLENFTSKKGIKKIGYNRNTNLLMYNNGNNSSSM